MRRFGLAATVSAAALALASSASAAINVNWANWTVASAGTVLGAVGTVGVSYTGGYTFAQTNGGTDFWTDGGYTQGLVNRPTGTDIIALDQGGRKVITFSQAVVDPFMAFTSWQGNTATFSAPFTVISQGCGFWGCGTCNTFGGNTGFTGGGEVHGVLQFKGTFTSLSFTDTSENWHGFTVGVGGVVPEPATWAMMIMGFGLAGGALRSRRRVAALG